MVGLSAHKGAYLEKLNLARHERQQWNPFDSDRYADLSNADLSGAILSNAILSNAILSNAILSNAILLATDLRKAKNFDPTQLRGEQQPLLCNVALPEGFKDKDKLKDRDCDRLPQELLKRKPESLQSLEEAKKYVDEAKQKKWK